MNDEGGAVRFAAAFDAAVASFCLKHGYPQVVDDWRSAIDRRLPLGLRTILGNALAAGSVDLPDGTAGFRLPALPGKGPYALFSRSASGVPAPNWEYFVQLAEYARLTVLAPERDWTIGSKTA